jgi:predicted nucleotidyltransferase
VGAPSANSGRTVNPNDPNVLMLDAVAERLGSDLCEQLVFVGGAVVGLLITDPAQPAIRPTDDVDLVAHVLARADYHALEQRLRAHGFQQDMRPDAPICRWRVAGFTVDVMPTLPDILGFGNSWYPLACSTAWAATLPSGRVIQVISAPAFVATKLEAFAGRGQGDHLFSHDLGDVISLMDGRNTLLAELQSCDPSLSQAVATSMSQLLLTRKFMDSLPGHLPGDPGSQARLPDLLAQLHRIAALAGA